MAKKTIIPDFTLALGADLREAAAKMREMSRPPAHHAALPAPGASFPTGEEASKDMPSAGTALKNAESAPKDAAANAPLYVADATPSQSSVPLVQNSKKTAHFSDDADDGVPIFSEKTCVTPDFPHQETDDTVTSKETAGSPLPSIVNDKKHYEEPSLSSENESVTTAPQGSPLSETVPEKDAVLLAEEPEAPSLPSSPQCVPSPSPVSQPQGKELSDERKPSAQNQAPAMNPPKDNAPLEIAFTPAPPPEERVPSPGKSHKEPLCPPQPSTTYTPPESSVQTQESGAGAVAQTDPSEGIVTTAPTSDTVIDCHQQLHTVNDDMVQIMALADCDDCLVQSQTVTGSHLPSSTDNDNAMTVDDRHSSATQSDTTLVCKSPLRERMTDVSPSFPVGTPEQAPRYSRSPTSPQPEKTAASPSLQNMSSRVTMTVTDTYNIQESHSITPLVSGGGISIASATLQEAPLGGARQTLLNALDTLRGTSPQVVVNLKRLAAAIGLSYGTVRNTISRLVREGIICTTQVRTSEAHGVCIEFLDDTSLQSLTVMGAHAFPQPAFVPVQSSTVTNSHQPSMPVNDNLTMTHIMTADDTSIWSVDVRLMADLWPYAAQAGLNPTHLAQVRRAYQVQGWDAGNVPRCLRYLDWELAQGLAAGPEHVAGWLRVMQRQGHYPRPEGYADPEVLRLQQQAEEQRELAQARQDAANARAFLDATSRQS